MFRSRFECKKNFKKQQKQQKKTKKHKKTKKQKKTLKKPLIENQTNNCKLQNPVVGAVW